MVAAGGNPCQRAPARVRMPPGRVTAHHSCSPCPDRASPPESLALRACAIRETRWSVFGAGAGKEVLVHQIRNPAGGGAGFPQGGQRAREDRIGDARFRQGGGRKIPRQGGAAGGLSRRPCGHCINEGGVWSGQCNVCFGHYVHRSPGGGRRLRPGATSPRLEIPCGREEDSPAQCGCVSVYRRCARFASAVRVVAVTRRPLPRYCCPCPFPQEGEPERAGGGGERDATHPPYPRGGPRSSPVARNVPGRTWVAFGSFDRDPDSCVTRIFAPQPAGCGGHQGSGDNGSGRALCEGQRCHVLYAVGQA